jgi:hypothetical protein
MTKIPLENRQTVWQHRVVRPTLGLNRIFLSEISRTTGCRPGAF